MANEITVTVQVSVNSSNYVPGAIALTDQIDQGTVGGAQNVQTINTSVTEAITIADAVPGVLYMRNLDGTNYMNYGTSTGVVFKLKATEQAVVRISTGATIYAQANTAPCQLFTWAISD